MASLPSELMNPDWVIPVSELTVQQQIGRGFFGLVFRGSWNGQEVAIKKIYRSLPQRELEMFAREIRIISSLRSPFIVLFMGLCEYNAEVLLVTEFMHRGSLHDALQAPEMPKSISQRCQMIRDIARGTHLPAAPFCCCFFRLTVFVCGAAGMA